MAYKLFDLRSVTEQPEVENYHRLLNYIHTSDNVITTTVYGGAISMAAVKPRKKRFNMRDCDFHQTSLNDLNQQQVDLRSVEFKGCSLSNWRLASGWFANCRFENVTMHGGNFTKVTFNNCYFTLCKLSSISFNECTFVDCHFSSSDLWWCSFTECQLMRCNFSGGNNDLAYSRFSSCRLTQVNFSHTRFPESLLNSGSSNVLVGVFGLASLMTHKGDTHMIGIDQTGKIAAKAHQNIYAQVPIKDLSHTYPYSADPELAQMLTILAQRLARDMGIEL